MSIEVRPVGVACNLGCVYCYQNPERDTGNAQHRKYDMPAMKAKLAEKGGAFTVFGGEGLLVPEDDLEDLWKWGFERWGSNGIQTNGTLINDNHIRMFKQYKVNVGLSVDGPDDLNDARWCGTLQATREATAKTLGAIKRLIDERVGVSLIITLHRGNATAEKLPRMHEWARELDVIGVRHARLHTLEIETENVRNTLSLSPQETIGALWSFQELEPTLSRLKFDIFKDMRLMLKGQDKRVTCIWKGCDPLSTSAVQGVEGNGQASNCTRTNKDGIEFVKADVEGFERHIALYHTPQAHGGCQGCKYFLMCRGNCPGTSIDGDWRNRSADCPVWMELYDRLEAQMLDKGEMPLSRNPSRQIVEECLINSWANGLRVDVADILVEVNRRTDSDTRELELLPRKFVEKELRGLSRRRPKLAMKYGA